MRLVQYVPTIEKLMTLWETRILSNGLRYLGGKPKNVFTGSNLFLKPIPVLKTKSVCWLKNAKNLKIYYQP